MRGIRARPCLYDAKRATLKRLLFVAEREGFEPPVPLSTVVFKTTVIDHSTISPVLVCPKAGAKVRRFFELNKFFGNFL